VLESKGLHRTWHVGGALSVLGAKHERYLTAVQVVSTTRVVTMHTKEAFIKPMAFFNA
jgi:hypothetical protein